MSKTALYTSISVCLLLVATAAAAPDREPVVVGYLPAADGAVNEALLAGLREGLAGQGVRLVVGAASERWSNAAPEAVRLIVTSRAAVLVTPPDRRVAHLMAQVATRTQVPLVSTSSAPTVGATGSTWVSCVATGANAEGTDWIAVGRAAARAALAHLER